MQNKNTHAKVLNAQYSNPANENFLDVGLPKSHNPACVSFVSY